MPIETPETKAFIKRLSALDRSKSERDKFRDFCEMSYCAIAKLTADPERAETIEARYMQIVGTYGDDKDTVRAYPELLAMVMDAVAKGQDFLGSVSSQLNVLNSRQGQFFTPYPLSTLMATMTLSDIAPRIEEKGYITLHEPACGAGGMVLACADVMQEQGYDPTQHLLVHAVDVSPLCYHMAVVQLTFKGVPAFVEQGNSLTLERFNGAWTPPSIPFHQQHGVVFPTSKSSPEVISTPEPTMTTPDQPTLQQDMFSGEQVDRRTRIQKQKDKKREQPTQQEMFRQRELAQFGVKVKQMDAPATPLVLISEDPRTEEEKEHDLQREAESLTAPMFGEDIPPIAKIPEPDPQPIVPSEEHTVPSHAVTKVIESSVVPVSVNLLMEDTPLVVEAIVAEEAEEDEAIELPDPDKKNRAYMTLVQVSQEQITTTWVDRLYERQFAVQVPLAILEAKECGLTLDEITAATQIGQVLGNEAVQKSQQAEIETERTQPATPSCFSEHVLCERLRNANVPLYAKNVGFALFPSMSK